MRMTNMRTKSRDAVAARDFAHVTSRLYRERALLEVFLICQGDRRKESIDVASVNDDGKKRNPRVEACRRVSSFEGLSHWVVSAALWVNIDA